MYINPTLKSKDFFNTPALHRAVREGVKHVESKINDYLEQGLMEELVDDILHYVDKELRKVNCYNLMLNGFYRSSISWMIIEAIHQYSEE